MDGTDLPADFNRSRTGSPRAGLFCAAGMPRTFEAPSRDVLPAVSVHDSENYCTAARSEPAPSNAFLMTVAQYGSITINSLRSCQPAHQFLVLEQVGILQHSLFLRAGPPNQKEVMLRIKAIHRHHRFEAQTEAGSWSSRARIILIYAMHNN